MNLLVFFLKFSMMHATLSAGKVVKLLLEFIEYCLGRLVMGINF